MYKYLYAVGRYKDFQPGFHVVDISNYYVKDLEKLFSILYVVIEDQLYNVNKAITLDDYRTDFAKDSLNGIQGWLDNKNQVVLKTSEIVPGKNKQYVKMERLFTNGYFHHPADINLAKDSQSTLLADSSPDVRLAHYKYIDGIDYNKQVEQSLFTVNGVFVRALGRQDGIYLLGAGFDYMETKQDLRIGALNFQKIGKIKTIPITEDLLFNVDSNVNKRWKIKLTDQSLNNKTIWAVVNGQLLTDPDLIYQVGDNEIMLDMGSFDAMSHYQTYREYTRTPKLTNMLKIDEYKSNVLTMHNSFIILIDNPTIGISVTPLTTFHYPNVFHTEERFEHPLMIENGLFPVPYVKTYGVKQRLLNHDIRIKRHYPIQTSGVMANNFVNSLDTLSGNPGHLPKGFLFKIFGVNFERA